MENINLIKYYHSRADICFKSILNKMEKDDEFLFSVEGETLIKSYFGMISELNKIKCIHFSISSKGRCVTIFIYHLNGASCRRLIYFHDKLHN